jgi:hypothetical protein
MKLREEKIERGDNQLAKLFWGIGNDKINC